MSKPNNIFIKIDEFIFQKLDLLKTEGVFQKFNDMIAGLDEAQQKLVAQLTTFFFILAPFFVALFLWWGNTQTKKGLEIKKQIIEQIAFFDGNQTALNNISANYLSPTAIMTENDLDSKLKNIMASYSIDSQKVSISGFTQASTTSTISKIEAIVSFRGFGTSDFANFVRGLTEAERFKILKVDLVKNKESSLLQGSIALMHMGQNSSSAAEE
jgi:hypothetical protein